MGDANITTELKAAAQDALQLGARYVQVGRAWLNERRNEMANRNEQQGRDQEESTYGRPGGYQAQGSNPYQSQSQYQPRPHQGPGMQAQGMRGYGGDENLRLQSHGYGSEPLGRGQQQAYAQGREGFNEFNERAQGWQQERGWDAPEQSRQFGQAGSNSPQGFPRQNLSGQHEAYGSESLGYGAAYSQQRARQSARQGFGASGGSSMQGEGLGSGQGREYGMQGQQDWRIGQIQSGDYPAGTLGTTEFGMGGYSTSGYGATSQGMGRGFRGRGPKNYSRSDERIREDLCERLTQDDDIDASEIEVKAEQGVVTLEGTVEQRWMKHRAEDLADAIAGVRQVENRLRVQGSESAGRTQQQGRTGTSTKTGSTTGTTSGGSSGSITPH